jgi:hypothetical protein
MNSATEIAEHTGRSRRGSSLWSLWRVTLEQARTIRFKLAYGKEGLCVNLPVRLEEIAAVPPSHIVLINRLGTHRANTQEERVGMLGRDIVENYRIVQHGAWDRDKHVLPEPHVLRARGVGQRGVYVYQREDSDRVH